MTTTRITLAAALATAAALTVAAPALAQEEDDADPPRAEFVCANLDQITQLQSDHAALIGGRIALLAEARVAAEQAGNAKAVERIDRRTERLNERSTKVAERQQRLADFAAANCGG